MEENTQEFVDKIIRDMIEGFNYSEQNQIWLAVKQALIDYRTKQAEISKQAANELKKLR